MSGTLKMTVNVSLCGSIPRSQMNLNCQQRRMQCASSNSQSPSNFSIDTSKTTLCLPRQVSCEHIVDPQAPMPPPIIEPPVWAVAAKGDARLEPVCESLNLQSSVDLTSQAVYRIGRSQNSDVQLLHCTSSRRHAILFHHPNGSCYVVDCGSAHGTYVNGVRVKTVMHTNNNININGSSSSTQSSGIILPHRLKKGALIRFGGPGAPCFILKSFSVGLESLVNNLKETNTTNVCKDDAIPMDQPSLPTTCRSEQKHGTTDYSSEALVKLNTRLNAVTSTRSAKTLSSKNISLSLTSARLHSQLQTRLFPSSNISFLKKRSIVSFDDENDVEREIQPYKKLKMATNSTITKSCPFENLSNVSNIAIVSPSRQKPTLHFNFDEIARPVVSPTPIEENTPLLNLGSKCCGIKSILTTPLSLPSSTRKTRRIIFSEKPPEVFYPPTITPETTSDCGFE